MNSDCFVFVEERDEFRMWQGLVGPYYTPAVDSLGNLSWTNNGNLVNPPTVNVSGRGLTITGIVDTAGDLPASAPQYTCYLVGTTSLYHAYIWDGTTWTDLGIVGKGDDGFSPTVTVSAITGGHQVAITDADGTNTFNVMDGADGSPGQGVPSGGTTGQVLKKQSAMNYDSAWRTEDLGITGASVGDLVRISAVSGGKPTAFTKVPLNEIKCNRNLFANWYFVGGGSQLGYGVFPVNQRGQGTYMLSPNSYGMDRWGSFDVGSKHTLNSYGVLVETNGSNYALFAQRVSNFPKGTITISFLTGNVAPTNPVRIYLKFSDNTNDYYDCSGVGQNDLGYHTFTVSKTVTEIRFYTNASGSKFSLQAAKAEPGDTQTLAHQEGGVWVLNEIPDYGEQLTACQHYAVLLPGTSAYNGYANSETVVRIAVPCPAQFAGTPSLQYGGTGFSYLRLIGNGVALSPTSATALNAGNEIVLEFTVSGATQNATYALKNNGATILMYV